MSRTTKWVGVLVTALLALGVATVLQAGPPEPVCGDGNLDSGEECDDNNTMGGDGCSASCTIEVCGNGIVDVGEECDDNNTTGGDGCSAMCTVEECGNGVLDVGEQCDDSNTTDGDGCSSTCQNENAGGKVTLCHKGKKTLSVSANAVPAHLGHGDALGACP